MPTKEVDENRLLGRRTWIRTEQYSTFLNRKSESHHSPPPSRPKIGAEKGGLEKAWPGLVGSRVRTVECWGRVLEFGDNVNAAKVAFCVDDENPPAAMRLWTTRMPRVGDSLSEGSRTFSSAKGSIGVTAIWLIRHFQVDVGELPWTMAVGLK